MNDFKEFMALAFIAALVVVFFVIPAVKGMVAGWKRGWARCTHSDPATFRFGSNEGHILSHCFSCGCSRMNETAWTDYGARSGNEVIELIAELESELEPEECTDDEEEAPAQQTLSARVWELYCSIGGEKAKPECVMLGRAELAELSTLLVLSLERANEFKLANQMKKLGGKIEDARFLRLVRERMNFFGMSVQPNLKEESIIAIGSK